MRGSTKGPWGIFRVPYISLKRLVRYSAFGGPQVKLLYVPELRHLNVSATDADTSVPLFPNTVIFRLRFDFALIAICPFSPS